MRSRKSKKGFKFSFGKKKYASPAKKAAEPASKSFSGKKDPRLEKLEMAAKISEMIKEDNTEEMQRIANEAPPDRKESLFSKLFRSHRVTETEEEDIKMPIEEDVLDPQTLEAFKIAGKWLMRLDSEAKREFRESADYVKYRAFLEKYNLAKKR